MDNDMSAPLVLASSSVHRRALLDRLQLDYAICAPDIDESRRPDEAPTAYVSRLSLEKAAAVAARHPQSLIIGSDQAAVLDGDILGKPGNHERATAQLRRASGQHVDFYTGLSLLSASNGRAQTDVVLTRVHFRQLDDATIERYLQRERPYDCAGSFRSEALGIALFERLEGDDPTALVGLPLIRLVSMLASEGFPVP
jgi:MAF protein